MATAFAFEENSGSRLPQQYVEVIAKPYSSLCKNIGGPERDIEKIGESGLLYTSLITSTLGNSYAYFRIESVTGYIGRLRVSLSISSSNSMSF
jgi:hypothetical protein